MNNTTAVADTALAAPLRWLGFVAKVLLPAGLFTISILAATATPAHAQLLSDTTITTDSSLSLSSSVGLSLTIDPNAWPATKLSADLVGALNGNYPSNAKWVKSNSNGMWLKVLVMGIGSDAQMTALRSAVLAAGGSVYYAYQSVQGLSAMLPASQLLNIAARSDVDSISSNRVATKTASFMEATTGASSVRGGGYGTGYDGSGVGIAVLDSGIFYAHGAFRSDSGGTRVQRMVDFTRWGDPSDGRVRLGRGRRYLGVVRARVQDADQL